MTKEIDELSKAIALGTVATAVLQKSRVSGYTKKNGTTVQEHQDSRPDHGHMRFAYKDMHGNTSHIHVTKDRISAGGGPDQRTPMGLSNYMFMHRDLGDSGASKKFKEAVRTAYDTSAGDPQKVLAAIKDVTKLHKDTWSLHSHDLKKSEDAPGDAEPDGDSDDLQKAVSEVQGAADLLLKSHVEGHTRTSASGTVSQVSAYDDKRTKAEVATDFANHAHGNVLIDKPSSMTNAAAEHAAAAEAHVEAMAEAHKSGKGNKAINEHMHAASRHLQAAHSLRSFHKEHAEAHAKHSTEQANWLSSQADKHDRQGKEDESESLNHGSSIHMLAKEGHDRAAEAHMALANKHFGTEKGEKHMETARGHRDAAAMHGKEVQRLSRISIEASDKARAASKTAEGSGKAEDHKAAAEAHHAAAKLDYDSETSADHEKQAAHHEKKAQEDPSAKLAELKRHEFGGPTFSQKILHHGKESGTDHQEIARMSSAIHASETAHSKESHARAYFEHKAAAAEAKNPVYKQYHEETAAHHKKTAGLDE